MISKFYIRTWLALCTLLLMGGGMGWAQCPDASTLAYTPDATENRTRIVCAGTLTTFSVSNLPATGSGITRGVQWQTSTDNGVNWSNTNTGVSTSGTTTTLSVTPTGTLDGRLYRLRVTYTNTNAGSLCSPGTTYFSEAFTLRVRSASITTQPSSFTTCTSGSASFTVAASSTGPSTVLRYQWEYDTGSGYTNFVNGSGVSGATAATLNLSSAALVAGTRQVRVKVTPSDGTTDCGSGTTQTSTARSLTVTDIVIGTQPTDQIACTGGTVVFQAENVTGPGTLSYQWESSTDGGTTWANVSGSGTSGATSASLSISGSALSTFAGRLLRLRISSNGYTGSQPACSPVHSNTVSYTISGVAPTAPAFSASSTSGNICNGQPVNITITNPQGGATYTWWRTNASATFSPAPAGGDPVSAFSNDPPATPASGSTITGTLSTASGDQTVTFTVRATGSNGCFSQATRNVTVRSAANSVNPSIAPPAAICDGQTATLTATATGAGATNANPSFQWRLNGTSVSGANVNPYTTPNLATGTYTYDVVVTARSGSGASNYCSVTAPAVVQTVNANPTATPASLTACSTEPGGSTASFDLISLTATILNGQPNTSVSFFNDANLTSAVSTPAAHVSATGTVYAQVTNTLTGCKSTAGAITLTVVPAPNAGMAGAALSRCINSTEAIALADHLTGEDPGGTWSLTTAPGGSTYSHSGGSFTPSATGVVAGTYVFTYTVSGTAPCPNATAQVTVNVHALPTAPTAPAPQTFCTNTLPHTFTFSVAPGSGADAIEWATNPDFSGAIQVVGNPATFTIGVNSSVTVYVRSKNTTTGCVSEGVSTTATVHPRPTAAVSGGGTVCADEALPSVLFTFSGNVPFSLTYSDGTNPTTVPNINSASYQLQNAPAGTYTVTALSDANCAAEAADLTGSATVTVHPLPTVFDVSGGGTFCAPSATVTLSGSQTGFSYQLQNASNQNVGSAQTGTGSALTFTVTASGTYHVVATSNTTPACTAPMSGTAEITLNSAQGTATLSGTATVCAGGATDLAVNITGASGAYTVVYSDGTSSFTVNSYTSGSAIPVSPPATTTYSLVSVTAANGCPAASLEGTATVTVRPLPTATVGTTTPAVCQSGQGTLTFTGQENTTISYTIADVNGTSSASVSLGSGQTSKNVTVFPNFSTTYAITSVAYTDAPACANSITGQSVTIQLRDLPTATLTGTATVCEGGSTTLTLTATPNTTVVYTKGGVNQDPVSVGPSGTATIPTGTLSTNTTFALFTVGYADTPTCQQVINNQTVIVTVRPAPTASIAGSTAVCAGETATLTLTGTPGARVHFTATGTFADGTSRVLNNEGTATISGNFSETTTFTLTSVEYTDEPACPVALTGQSATATVTVNPKPTATVSGGGTVCAGETLPNVSIVLTGTAPWSITYTNGSGSTTVNGIATASYTLTNAPAGTYSVTSVSDAHCAGTASGSATVTVNPKPLFSLSATSNSVTTSASNASGPASLPLSICAGQSFSFAPVTTTPGSGVGVIVQITAVTGAPTYEGSPETTDPQPIDLGTTGSFFNNTSYGPHGGSGTITQVYTPYFDANTSGTYDAGDCLGDPITLNYTIHALPAPVLGGDAEVCVGSTIPLTSSVAGGTWSSSNPDVAAIDASSGVVTGVAPGTVTLTYTVTIDGCTGSSTKSVTVKPQPTLGGVSALATTVCDGEPVTFTASGLPPNASALVAYTLTGATTASGTVTLTTDASGNASYDPQVLAVGQTTLEITAVTANGCTRNFTGKTVTVTVNALTGTPVFTNPTLTLCQDAPNTAYAATSANATSIGYSLSPAEAGTISAETGIVDWSADFVGTATVTATATGLCGTTTASVQVLINSKPAPVIQASTLTPCYGTAAVLSLTTGYSTYSWKKTGNPAELGTGATFQATETGSYTVTVTNASGCTATSEPITITVGAQLVFGTPTITPVKCHGESTGSLAVSATGGSGTLTYTLMPGNVSNSTGTFAGLAAGTYSVTVADANDPVCQLTLANLEITQPAAALAASITAPVTEVCGTGSLTLTGSATGGTTEYTYAWSTSGAGSLAPALGSGATFTANGATPGSVEVLLTVTDANQCTSTATQTVTVYEPATANAGAPQTRCEDETFTLSGTLGGSATSATWTTSGTGTFSDAASLTATYTPSLADVGNGGVTLTLTTNDPTGPCAAATSTVALTINRKATVSVAQPEAICQGGTATLSATPGGSATGGTWTANQPGTFADATSASTTFTPSAGVTGPVVLTFTTNDPDGPCPAVSDQKTLQVNPKPAAPAGTVSLPGSDPAVLANGSTYTLCDGTSASANLTFTNALGTNEVMEVSPNADFSGVVSLYPTITLANGTWYLRVRNTETGCLSAVVTITIQVNPKPSLALNAEAGNANKARICFGATDGAIDITVTGGSGTFSYAWTKDGDPGFSATTQDLANLTGGDYTVVVSDANGCSATETFAVVATQAVTFTPTLSEIACFGENTGSIDVFASGGSSPYSFSKDGGATYAPGTNPYTFATLGAGQYDIRVKDSEGCESAPQTVTLAAPAELTLTATATAVRCKNGSDGSITATATGGTGGLIYRLGNGAFQESNVFPNLTAGSYTVYVTDENGCTKSFAIEVTEPAWALDATITAQTDVTCKGEATGSLTVEATAGTGTPGYTYSINGTDFFASGTFSGLTAGAYTVTVKDANGCTKTVNATITEPAQALNASASVTSDYNGSQVSCATSSDGQITATATGGTGTYAYVLNGPTVNTTGASSGVFTGLSAGAYTVTVTDANGCTFTTGTVTITAPPALGLTSASVTSDYNGSQVSCATATDGEITLVATGGTGALSYTLGSTTNATGVFTGLGAGTYPYSITDANACTPLTGSVTITAPAALTATASTIETSGTAHDDGTICNGSSVQLSVSPTGGTGAYAVTWYALGNPTALGTGTQLSVSPTATTTYQSVVNDANDCSYTVQVVITVTDRPTAAITNTDPLTVCPGPTTATVSGTVTATGAWTLTLSDGSQATGTGSGTFSITVTPSAGANTYTLTSLTDGNACAALPADLAGSKTVTKEDVTNPTITAPGPLALDADNGQCYATNVTLGTPTTADNCSVASVVATVGGNEVTASTQFPVGETTVTWTVTDIHGNTATTTQTVTVTDTEKPTLTAPAPVTVSTDAGLCTASSVTLGSATANDNCGVQSVSNDAPAVFPKGQTTVTWTVTDIHGNTQTATQLVTVNDTEKPTFTAQASNQNVTLGSECAIVVPNLVALTTATDNCPGVTVTQSPAAGTVLSSSHNATTQVTITATDAGGLTESYTVTLTAKDLTAPTFTAQASNQNVTLDAECKLTIPNLVAQTTAADNCAGVTVTQSPAAGAVVSSSHNATVEVTVTATDAAGLTASYTVTLTGKDTTPPVVPTLAAATGECSVTLTAPTTSDNCAGTVTGTTTDPTTYSQQGTYTVTWSFSDGHGNTSTTQQQVVVDDVTPPVINVVQNTFNYQLSTGCTVAVDLGAPLVSDNCEGYTVSANVPGYTAGVTTYNFPVGTTTVTWTITDIGGNTDQVTQTVTVTDVAPVIATNLASSLTACENSPVSFGITLTSHSGPTAHYQWYKNGSPISGQTGPTLSFASVSTSDAGTYRVRVWGCTSEVYTESGDLTLSIDLTSLSGTIGAVPNICQGSSTTLTVTGTRGTIQWQQLVGSTWTNVGTGATTLNTGALSASTQFRVVVTNGVCSAATSDPYTVVVDQPSSGGTVAITVGQPATLCNVVNPNSVSGPQNTSVTVTGHVGNVIRWERATSLSGPWTTVASTSTTLPVSNLTMLTYFRAVVKNGTCAEAATSTPVAVAVSLPAMIPTQPANTTVCPGTSATFFVLTNPTSGVGYSWQSRPGVAAPFTPISGATASTYQVPAGSVTTALSGTQYQVLVTNGACTTTSGIATLTVNQPTAITTQPVGATRCPGGQVQFTVAATGTSLTYQWQKWNGTAYVNVNNVAGKISGATTTTLTVSNLQASDAAPYRVRVQGTCGTVNSNDAVLTLLPTITSTNPANQSVPLGGTATFSVTASGGALTYRWQRNGVNLNNGGNVSGATTNTLTITNVTLADRGNYRVVITNECGSINTNTATLAVSSSARLAAEPVQPVRIRLPRPLRTPLAEGPVLAIPATAGPVLTPAEPRAGAVGGADLSRRSAETEALAATVYPNPTDGTSFRVRMPGASRANLTLFDTQGRSQPIATRVLDADVVEVLPAARLEAGLYLLRVVLDGQRQVQKVIVRD